MVPLLLSSSLTGAGMLTEREIPIFRSPGVRMIDQAKPVARPWRRFLRISIRGIAALVCLVAFWLGWLVQSVRVQREAVAEIRTAGGTVKYDWEWSDGIRVSGGKPRAPQWTVYLTGRSELDLQYTPVAGRSTGSEEASATLGSLNCTKAVWRSMSGRSSPIWAGRVTD